ncbi:MAG: L-serine ammonia-lyase, iron-sulfur-dependent subunit beta [Oscillospiraceae bacterium]|jgi:L-serine dehydratase
MDISIFDVLGPVMIGPSSSHTAGAAKLARAARQIVGQPFFHVKFALHGSFAETYQGHGTDQALVAGVLGLREDDERLRESFELARKAGLGFSFSRADLGDVHQNTVSMTFYLGKQGDLATAPTQRIQGSSLGGGRILVTRIDSFDTEISLEAPTIVVMQKDLPGVVSSVTAALAHSGVNIGTMRVSRTAKGKLACCVLETDSPVDKGIIEEIRAMPNILHAHAIAMEEEETHYVHQH